MSFSDWVMQVSIFSILLPLAAGALLFRQLDHWSSRIFALVLLASVPQLLTLFLSGQKLLNVFYNLYTPAEFIIVYSFIGNKPEKKAAILINRVLVALFVFLSIALIASFGLYQRFLNEWVCAANFCYLVWCLVFLIDNMLSERYALTRGTPAFWFIAGWLIYTPCTIFVFALSGYIEHSKLSFIQNLWTIQGIFNTILYLFFAIGIFQCHSSRPVSETPDFR